MRTLIIIVTSFALGAFVGAWYQISQQTYNSEAIVAKEITLLEKHKSAPNCEVIFNANIGWGTIPINDGVIIWRHNIDQSTLQKVIVDKTMTIAYEELTFDCTKKAVK